MVVKPPDGSTCSQGTISANGPAVSDTISTTRDCKLWDAWDGDSVYTASYALAVTGGTIYSVTSTGTASGGWLENLLVGHTPADTEAIAAASTGYSMNSGSGNNVMWFYAPTSGLYSLRTLDEDPTVTHLAFTTQVVTCPVVATVAPSDTDYVDSTSSIATSGCKQQYTYYGAGDSSYVNYYLVQFNPGQTRYFGVQSSAFTPGWAVGGPNFDSMWNLDQDAGDDDAGNNAYASLTADSGGTFTLVVGSGTYGGSGAYTLSILAPSLAPQRVPPALTTQHATIHLKASQRLHMLR